MKVGVIDYGVGNLGSVVRALIEMGVNPSLVSRAKDLGYSDRLILPGVGNFSDCATLLEIGGWKEELLDQVVGNRRPLLGICVGMQLLADASTEGSRSEDHVALGLGLVPGRVEHLRDIGCGLRIPHVGWNSISSAGAGAGDPLLHGIPDGTDFYFVHSYAFVPRDQGQILATTDYGVPVVAAVRSGHVWGTQFHPERSSKAGFRLLQNFISSPDC